MDYGGFRIISADPEDPSAGKQNKAWPVCALRPAIMDFNVKKLASDAGVFFTRAVQVRRLAWLPARLPPLGPDVRLLHQTLAAAVGQPAERIQEAQRCFSASERESYDPHLGTSGGRWLRRPLEAINGL